MYIEKFLNSTSPYCRESKIYEHHTRWMAGIPKYALDVVCNTIAHQIIQSWLRFNQKSVDNTHISCETYQQFLVDAVPRCQSCYQNGCSHLKNVIRIVRNSKHCKIAQSWRLFISRHWNTSTYFKHSSGSTNVIKQGWAVSLEYVTLDKPEQAMV